MLHMKKKYKQLREGERERLFEYHRKGLSGRQIAFKLGRDVSTISRELRRNRHQKLDCYLPDTASRKATRRKGNGRKRRYLEKDTQLKAYVVGKLALGWSPELIAGRMEREIGFYVNHETIYQYIYSLPGRQQNLRQYLYRSHRIRRKKGGRKHHRGKIPNRIDISKRPKAVDDRKDFGHWEGDSLVYRGQRQVLASHTERKSRYLQLRRPLNRTSGARHRLVRNIFKKLPEKVRKTMTFDNGLEFAAHEAITRDTGMKIYFAKPYAACQRGTNERQNGLIRWYLPRSLDLEKISRGTIRRVQDLINNRPMKCLGFDTPKEVFEREEQKVFLQQARKVA